MAVYTELSRQEIEQLLSQYDIGDLTGFEEISSGIENTNYFVTCLHPEQGERRWVLTLFENLKTDDLPYFCDLTRHLEQDGFNVPAPVVNCLGNSLFCLKGKSGVIVPCLQGAALEEPDISNCASVGVYLAGMHLSLRSFSQHRVMPRDIGWMNSYLAQLETHMTVSEFKVLKGYFKRFCAYQPHLMDCPQGTVHGDLFRDNILFKGEAISGVIDFYHACDATFLFDLAVAANDWAIGSDGVHDKALLESLCEGYQSERAWTDKEKIMWPYCLELAALRFWFSRLASLYLPGYQQTSVVGEPIKNPDEMKAILLGLVACDEGVVIN